MKEQISITNVNSRSRIRFNIIFPTDIFYRGVEYDFYIKIVTDNYILYGWQIDIYINTQIAEIIGIENIAKEYPLNFSYIGNNGLITLMSIPLIRPRSIPNFILKIKLKIKFNTNIGINTIINRGIINHIEPIYYTNNIVDELMDEKRVTLGSEVGNRVIVENKIIRIFK